MGLMVQAWEMALLLSFGLLELSHLNTFNCKECWEIESSCVPMRKSRTKILESI